MTATDVSASSIEQRLTRATVWWSAQRPETATTSSVLGTGAVAALERWFADLVGHAGAVAVASGTLALYTALVAGGVEPDDRVVVAAHDWTAALTAVRLAGAEPVCADIGPRGILTAETVDPLTNVQPSAVIVTHLHGEPADTESIRRAVGPGVTIIDDISQALGARIGMRSVGYAADFTCTSLAKSGPLDGGEGGLVSARSRQGVQRLVERSQHPVRQFFEGIERPCLDACLARLHPAAAILAMQDTAGFADAVRAQQQLHARRRWHLRECGIETPPEVPGLRPSGSRTVALCSEQAASTAESVGGPIYPQTISGLLEQPVCEVAEKWASMAREVIACP